MPIADLGDSFEAFFNRAAEFFRHLSEIHWTPFALALGCLLAMQVARAWAWRNVLRAAYPDRHIAFLPLAAAYLAGAGINAVIPAHAGDVTKVFLVKRQIPDSSYPAVTSSFLVQTVFDTSVGLLVLAYAITQGLLPPLPRIPDLPAFELSFWADHPKTLAIVTGVILLLLVVSPHPPSGFRRSLWAIVHVMAAYGESQAESYQRTGAFRNEALITPLEAGEHGYVCVSHIRVDNFQIRCDRSGWPTLSLDDSGVIRSGIGSDAPALRLNPAEERQVAKLAALVK